MKDLVIRHSPLVLATVLLIAVPVSAQTTVSGQSPSGAHYRIEVPDGWQPADGLVIWNHGFSLSPVGPLDDDDMGPLADLQLAEGYAVAASSYSLTGWAVFQTVDDNEQMVQAFETQFGPPDDVLIYGASLGGIVTARDVEARRLGNVVGAMPICGAVGGSRIWDGGIDLRLLYDFVCGGVPGAEIPGGANGLSFPPDPAFDQNAMALAVNTCTGILAPPAARTPEQGDRLDALLDFTGLPEEFVLTDMGFVTFGLADLVFDPLKLGGAPAFENLDVDYGDAGVNAGIERIMADPDARRRLFENYTPSGVVGDVKIVSIHTDKDGLVIVENESEYASVVPPENLTTAIIVEDTPTHCGFTEAETVAAWESLRGWVAGLPQPNAATLQATCQGLDAGGLAQGPCRIDPGFVIPDLDVRVRLRGACAPGPTTHCLNDGRFKVEVEWEDFQGGTGDGNAVPQTDDTGAFWFFNQDNLELMVKVLDGRPINGHFWVFYGALTNVEYTLTVTDTETAQQRIFENPSGRFASEADTSAF